MLLHTLCIIKQFSESSGISNKLLSLRFDILLEAVLTKRALLVPVIFSDPLLFAGLLKNNFQLLNLPQRLSM
jgi:hypothetical protein